jgi:hypothetical protein
MSQEKFEKTNKYLNSVKGKLSDPKVPSKHENRTVEYKEFLERELKKTTTKASDLKLTVEKK